MKKKYSRHCRFEFQSGINIVPFLDILLVMVLIFMTTAPIFTQKSINIKVDLPNINHSSPVSNHQNNKSVVIEVNGTGQYTLIVDHVRRIHQLSLKRLIIEVQQRITANPKTLFLIGGAKEVPYNEIIKAVNLLHQNGVKSVGLMTNPI